MAFVDQFFDVLYVLIREKKKEKQEGSHRVAAEIVAGMIRGSKYWTVEMVRQKKTHHFLEQEKTMSLILILVG